MSIRAGRKNPGIENEELRKQIEILEKTLLEIEKTLGPLRDSEKRYRRLFESARDGILILDAETGRVVDVNPFLLRLLGYRYEKLVGQHIWDLGVFRDIATSKDTFKILQDNEYIRYDDLPLETLAGQPIAVEFVSNVYLVDQCKVIQCNIRDITARKRDDAERKRLMAAIEQSGEVVVMTDAEGVIQFVNPAFERTSGYAREEAIGQNPSILKSGKQDKPFYRHLWDTISGGKIWAGVTVNRRKDGTLYTEEGSISPVREASGRIVNYVGVKRDITEHLRLTAQFQQAQKLEAVGLLAGGVAHDYNNMLCVILAYTELAMQKVGPTQLVHAYLEGIYKSAMRATDITAQLLAFSRKQAVVPRVLDLNKSVEGTLAMLRRLIGENIELVWVPLAGACLVKMDPVQVGQILANLCVNARDAIADVGKVTIETGCAVLGELDCVRHAGAVAGEYVLLAVSDDGCGMDKEILDQIFEPFFTTKDVGRGTGLGLSTVYGIVKQNNGFIDVSSEPGKGTTFRIYLPRCADTTVDAQREVAAEIPLGSGETILVVEDEPSVLAVAKAMLEELGYQVLSAATPDKAISMAQEHADEIRLVLSDVVMPGMNGRDLAARIKPLCPGVETLFMSGHTADVIVGRGVLEDGANFIGKPFSMKDLAVNVRNVLREKQAGRSD